MEREDRYAWIILHEPMKLQILENSPRTGDMRMMSRLCVVLHTLSPPAVETSGTDEMFRLLTYFHHR
jgi:hypothetical protein